MTSHDDSGVHGDAHGRPVGSVDETYVIERPGADGAPAAELHVERVGNTAGRSVYYLHGGPGYNSYSFRDLMGDDLTAFDVIYADQRGGGRSYGDASASVSVLAHDVIAVLDALGVASVSLLAHGFGAAIAVRASALRPDLVDTVVLVNPWLSMPLLAATLNAAARTMAAGGDPTRLDADDGAVGDEPDPLDATPLDDPLRLVDEAFTLVNPKVLFDTLEFPTAASRLQLEHVDAVALSGDLSDETPVEVWSVDELPRLSDVEEAGVRLVVISGAHDHTSYPVQAEQALLRSPSALFSLLEAGHYPWIDDPESFTPVLLAALGAGEEPS